MLGLSISNPASSKNVTTSFLPAAAAASLGADKQKDAEQRRSQTINEAVHPFFQSSSTASTAGRGLTEGRVSEIVHKGLCAHGVVCQGLSKIVEVSLCGTGDDVHRVIRQEKERREKVDPNLISSHHQHIISSTSTHRHTSTQRLINTSTHHLINVNTKSLPHLPHSPPPSFLSMTNGENLPFLSLGFVASFSSSQHHHRQTTMQRMVLRACS